MTEVFACNKKASLPFQKFENASGAEYLRYAFRESNFFFGGIADLVTYGPGVILAAVIKAVVVTLTCTVLSPFLLVRYVAQLFDCTWDFKMINISNTFTSALMFSAKTDHVLMGKPIQIYLKEGEQREDYLNAVRIFTNQYAIPFNKSDTKEPAAPETLQYRSIQSGKTKSLSKLLLIQIIGVIACSYTVYAYMYNDNVQDALIEALGGLLVGLLAVYLLPDSLFEA